MFPKCFHFVMLVVVSLQLKGTACFFVKDVTPISQFERRHIGSLALVAKCINDTGQIQSNGSWGNLSFLKLSYYSCLDPAAQFRFRDNGAMLNLKRQGCLAALHRNGSGYDLDMFYLYVDSASLDTAACAQKPNESIYRAITQTPEGALSVYYKGKDKSSFQTWCAYYSSNSQLYRNYGISGYMALSTPCHPPTHFRPIKKFGFGSVTCHGDKVKNANCPKDQYMVVKFASYRGLLAPKTCGLSDDYSCKFDVTCRVKKQCDGLHECNINVDDNLFPGGLCPGLSNYLYFEYRCVDTVKPYKGPCAYDVSLSYSPLPYEGVVQITTDDGIKNVCWKSLHQNHRAMSNICYHLGHSYSAHFLVKITTPPDVKNATFSGSFNCSYLYEFYFKCSINASASESCSELAYIQCGKWVSHKRKYKALLQDKRRSPDSSFSASASSEGHSASDARISSGSSWCAPVSNDTHYLQADLGGLYEIPYLVTYGDSTGLKWVTRYTLNYTINLVNWKTHEGILRVRKNAYNIAAWRYFRYYIYARALRFIPLTYVGQPCMRVEIWGRTYLIPDKPTNLTVTNITSRSAEISWADPKYSGIYSLSRFRIKLKKENHVFLIITTGKKVKEYKRNNLTPYTTYEISVAAGNRYEFGEESITSFLTSEEAPSGPPLNIRTTSRSASSLSFAWDPPDTTKQNGLIISYTACVSHSENGPCFQTFTTSERKWLVGNLNSSTKYYVRVLASTKIGHGNYSESEGYFTNGRAAEKTIAETSSTLTFSLKIPSKSFVYFYVVALKLKDGKEPASSDDYENNELVTYAEAGKSSNPKPYIAAVVTSSGVDGNMFILGDGRNTDDPTSRKRRSTTSDYFNGPLEPGTSYSVFQRIIINEMGEYYSTDWSPPSKTSEDTDRVPGDVSDTDDSDGFAKYLVAIIIASAILLIILCVIAYCIYTRRLRSSTDVHGLPNSQHDDIGNCEQVRNKQLAYITLKSPGEDNDDHFYGHLNSDVQNVCADQKETGI